MLLSAQAYEPIKNTTQVDVYAPPVIAIKLKDGIVVAANTIGLQGNTFKFNDVNRFTRIENMIFSSSGDYSDFQKVSELLKNEHHRQKVYGDVQVPDPKQFGSYLASLCYKKRCKIDPFLMEGILGGVKDGKSYLTTVDMYGNQFCDQYIATSFARYMCPPLIEPRLHENMTYEEAKELLIECFKVIYSKFKLTNNSCKIAYLQEKDYKEELIDFDIPSDYKKFLNLEELI